MNETVLVVDDEERIRFSLRGILSDEGFRVVDTGDAASTLEIIAHESPALVLLDIWMPGLDGIELLRQIKLNRPSMPVVMISGHANIQSAVAATRLGAADFIEKPFSVEALLASIGRALNRDGTGTRLPVMPAITGKAVSATECAPQQNVHPQRTIAKPVVMAGQGLHTGLRTGLILHPAPAGFGIVFSSLGEDCEIPATLENVTDTGYNTTLSRGGHSIRTVEHLMSALHGLGITNLLVKTYGEVPVLDGSAVEICRELRGAGISTQQESLEPVRVAQPICPPSVSDKKFIRIEPADHLIIDYTLDYPHPIGVQQIHFELDSAQAYEAQIAPARTFGFVGEFRKLAEMGLASGGRLDNLILVDDEKVVNTALRFPDEFGRHKVLDLVGDLYLLGRPLLGHVIAARTGHSDNLALVRAISSSLAG